MSSYLQSNIPTPKPLFTYTQLSGNRGLPNGTHYFVCMFGKVTDEAEEYWQNLDQKAPTAALIKPYCQMWVHEKAAQSDSNNGYARWLYTGPEDPVHVLGLDTKDQSVERLKQIYGDKAPKYPRRQPEVEYILPVFKVQRKGKTYDMGSAEAMLLIITDRILDEIIVAAKNFQDLPDPSIYGKILCVDKDLSVKDPKAMYTITIPFMTTPLDTSEQENLAVQMRSKAIEDINKVFNEANGGEYSSENVWKYLSDISGLSQDQFVDKYNVKTNGVGISDDAEIEEIEL